jgi:hypothetical protein
MGIVGYVQKDGKNQAQSYKYASAEAVLKKVNAELSARAIAISSVATLEHFNVEHYETKGKTRDGSDFTKQNFRSDAVVKLSLTFTSDIISVDPETNATSINHEEITVEGIGASTDLGDKAVMKANTAAIKYCLTNAFLISWGDDPEASTAGDAPSAPKASKPKAKAKASKPKATKGTAAKPPKSTPEADAPGEQKTSGLKKAENF